VIGEVKRGVTALFWNEKRIVIPKYSYLEVVESEDYFGIAKFTDQETISKIKELEQYYDIREKFSLLKANGMEHINKSILIRKELGLVRVNGPIPRQRLILRLFNCKEDLWKYFYVIALSGLYVEIRFVLLDIFIRLF
jgi:hypothetical protein